MLLLREMMRRSHAQSPRPLATRSDRGAALSQLSLLPRLLWAPLHTRVLRQAPHFLSLSPPAVASKHTARE
jgi:hypothetical protein